MLQHKPDKKSNYTSDQESLNKMELCVANIKRCLRNSEDLAKNARDNANRILDDITHDINTRPNGN